MKLGLANLRRLSPVAQLSPFLVGKTSPTASLYFENACGDWLADGRVQKIAPTVFASALTQLIFRHDTGVPASFSRPKTVYFMDDFWQSDPNLPWQYRQKSKLVEQRAARFFMPRSDYIGLSSEPLLQLVRREFPKIEAGVLHPFWSEPLADLEHFDQPGLEICYLGARSHANDLSLIIPAVRAVLADFPEARFTISAQHDLPDDLARHPRVCRLPTMGWQEYRQKIATKRFHIALYPLRQSMFNTGRSINKLIEHAVIGAATMCSHQWHSDSARVIAVAGGVENWTQKLCEIASQKEVLKQVAQENKKIVELENRPDTQRALWKKLLFPK